jgi:hypothetical protein
MKNHRPLRDLSLSLLVSFWLAPAVTADPTNMCVPTLGGLAGLPTIDGVVNDDPGALNTDAGWNGATRVNLGEIHGSTPTAVTEVGFNGAFLYLAFVVSSPLVSPSNTIVLGISPQDGDSTHDWRIHMRPFNNAVNSTNATDFTNLPPDGVTYWRNSATWNSGVGGTTAAAGTWLIDNTRVQKVGSQWSVEMQVPMIGAGAAGSDTGIFFPSTPLTFSMYVDVLNTLSSPNAVTLQTPWPVNQPICSGVNPCGINTFLTHNTPPIANWGTVSLFSRPICAGVTLAFNDIGVLDPNVPLNPPIITDMRRAPGPFAAANINQCAGLTGSSGLPNTFIARPLNNGPNPAPIDVTFRIANWGIPGVAQFDPLPPPPPGVATPPTHTVSPGAGATDRDITTIWSATFEKSCQFSFIPHQCIHVDLSSPDLSITFEQKSVERNMDFVPASTFRRKAYISGNQGPLRPGTTKHRLLLALDMDHQGLEAKGGGGTNRPGIGSPLANDRTNASAQGGGAYRRFLRADIGALVNPQANASFASWIARGLLYTSGHVRIDDKDFVILDDVGDFGYIATHDEPIAKWNFGFSGANLQRINDRLYLLDVAPGEAAEVETVISANEGVGGGAYRVFLDVGPNFPHGNFSNAVDGKLSVNAGLERFLAPNTSIEGIAGYHSFKSPFVSNPHIWQLSVNGKQYFGPGPLHFFLNGGIGVYRFDPGHTTKLGANVGAGVLYDFSTIWGIEGVYNFHAISTSPSRTQFSTVQIGIRRKLF